MTNAQENVTEASVVNVNQTEVQWHFAIPIFTKLVPGFAENKEALIELINKHTEDHEHVKPSAKNTWQSPGNLHLLSEPCIEWLTQAAGIMANDCIGSRHPNLAGFDIIMEACWGNVFGSGGWQPPHNHFPAQWSGILYVSIDDAIQQDPSDQKSGRIDFFNPIPIPGAYGQPTSVTYTPKDGLLVLFPSLVQHMVHPNMADVERYTVAFNLNVIPRMPQQQVQSQPEA